MFRQYCGKPNPDDASFCGACGENIAWAPEPAVSRVAATPAVQAAPAPAPPPEPVQSEPLHVVSDAEERLVRSILAPQAKQDRWKLPNWLGVAAGIAVILMLIPHKDGSGACDAMRNEVRQQVPFAVEILAARHPLSVGLLRSITKDSNLVDKLAEMYVNSEMQRNNADPGTVNCYVAYYAVMLQKDRYRATL